MNMHNDGTNNPLLTRDGRQIGTVFSRWGNTVDLERNRTRSLDDFQARSEQYLLADILKQIN